MILPVILAMDPESINAYLVQEIGIGICHNVYYSAPLENMKIQPIINVIHALDPVLHALIILNMIANLVSLYYFSSIINAI